MRAGSVLASPSRCFATLLYKCLNSIKKGTSKEIVLASHALVYCTARAVPIVGIGAFLWRVGRVIVHNNVRLRVPIGLKSESKAADSGPANDVDLEGGQEAVGRRSNPNWLPIFPWSIMIFTGRTK
ncbi:interferon-related developmental regulator family protein [Striga asiatica]|uniref:Interferon-related developmental regulator family protein n=1 Tax=Striga asiatica TaxID=4170 RepID=A0A5A7PA99_STRAF|nr:interferon-related developmental regulator family protein [Striga asiatica]